jgi:hypothetical protein
MGALPKNKITRVERGKRRHGNTPKLVKDANSVVPAHKQGFVAQLLKFFGTDTKTVTPKTETQTDSTSAKAKKAATGAAPVTKTAATKPTRQPATKTVRKAQHKG